MVPFKPAEIRIVAVLALLALAGSAVELINRQGDSSRLDLGIFSERTSYKYLYKGPETSRSAFVTDDSLLSKMSQVPDAKPVDIKIDINHCGAFDIEALPGIGPVLAEKIVTFRDSIGGFKSLDDLKKVKGIGPAKFALIKDRIEIK
jgi:competence ComEA-like helix-hairpin-helix protein